MDRFQLWGLFFASVLSLVISVTLAPPPGDRDMMEPAPAPVLPVRELPDLRFPVRAPPRVRQLPISVPFNRYKRILPVTNRVEYDRAKEAARQLQPVLLKPQSGMCRQPTSSRFSPLPNTFRDGCCISTPFLGPMTRVRLLLPDLARNRTDAEVYHGDGYQLFQAVSCRPVAICGCTCAQEHVIQNAVVLDHNNVPVNEIVVVPSCCKSIHSGR